MAPSSFLQNTGPMSCNSRAAMNQATAAQFSAVPSVLWSDFQLPNPLTRQGSVLWLLALHMSLPTVSNPRKLGPSGQTGICLSRAGHPVTMGSSLPLSGVSGKSVFLRLKTHLTTYSHMHKQDCLSKEDWVWKL